MASAGRAVVGYIKSVGTPEESVARFRAAFALHRAWTTLVNHQPSQLPADGPVARLRALNRELHLRFAEAMGETVADRVAAEFAGQEPEATFQGEGGCYLEVGNGQAMMVTGHFMAVPDPEVSLTEASAQHLEEKRAFEAQRLRAWFESA